MTAWRKDLRDRLARLHAAARRDLTQRLKPPGRHRTPPTPDTDLILHVKDALEKNGRRWKA